MADDTVPTPDVILNDESASDWLKNALSTALQRDPVDASHDAEMLAAVLDRRLRAVLERKDTH